MSSVETPTPGAHDDRRGGKGRVRPFRSEDASAIARIYRGVFQGGFKPSVDLKEYHESFFVRVFLDHPARDERFPSLVYETADEGVIGFLGVVSRPLVLGQRRISAVVSTHYMVDATSRNALAGVILVKALFGGPQDLTIADSGNDMGRRVWEKLGGSTSSLLSLNWVRHLRPCGEAIEGIRRRKGLALFALAGGVPARIGDGLLARLGGSPFHLPEPRLTGEDLTPASLLSCLSEYTQQPLRPAYDEASLRWALDLARQRTELGELRSVLVRDPARGILGWYLYYGRSDAENQVLQFGARPEWVGEVLEHLFHHAWSRGATRVVGRCHPQFIKAVGDRRGVFGPWGHWFLVRARDPAIEHLFHRGEVFFSRLEGEWCLAPDARRSVGATRVNGVHGNGVSTHRGTGPAG